MAAKVGADALLLKLANLVIYLGVIAELTSFHQQISRRKHQ